jgi:putative membrane protein insertion efficiency factor|tara:strand:- start:3044 stop:3313 length:270 start_codon:yes stop_codon:yes gene_type:complete
MSKILTTIIINIIKIYKFLISPIFVNRCRYLPTCSEYCIDSINTHGIRKGLYFGVKRILSCHPLKFLGGGSGLDLVPAKKKLKEKFNGQ